MRKLYVIGAVLVLGSVVTLGDSRTSQNNSEFEQHLWTSSDPEFEIYYSAELTYSTPTDNELIDRDYDAREDQYLEEDYDWPDWIDVGPNPPVTKDAVLLSHDGQHSDYTLNRTDSNH